MKVTLLVDSCEEGKSVKKRLTKSFVAVFTVTRNVNNNDSLVEIVCAGTIKYCNSIKVAKREGEEKGKIVLQCVLV